MDRHFEEAIKAMSEWPCAECSEPLGEEWGERYNTDTDRLEKVHLDEMRPSV